MEEKEKMRKTLTVAFLSALMLLTPFTSAQLFANAINQPTIYTNTLTKTVAIEGRTLQVNGTATVIDYHNGTKQVRLSIEIQGVSEKVQRLRVNLTKTVNDAQTLNNAENQQTLTSEPYEGPLRKENIYGVWFVLPPGNYSIWIKYKHPDNYETYYPGELYRHYDILGEEGFVATHLSKTEVEDWINQEISDEQIWNNILTGAAVIAGVLGALAYFFENPVLAVMALVSAITALFQWLLEVLGITNKAQWIIQTVQAEPGDGWSYEYDFKTQSTYGWILEPPILDIWSEEDFCRIMQYHRIGVLLCETREFYHSWGSEFEAGAKTTLTTEACVYEYVPSGILGGAYYVLTH